MYIKGGYMQKPITVARQEFIKKIATVVNESELPAFLVIDVLRMFLSQLEPQEETQFQRDLRDWEKYQAEKAERESDGDTEQER